MDKLKENDCRKSVCYNCKHAINCYKEDLFGCSRWKQKQPCRCPNYVVALLKDINDYLTTCYWNKNQRQMDSPFDNTGEQYFNDTIQIQAYQWDDDNDWNLKLKYNNVELIIEWYKYLGRVTCSNFELTPDQWVEVYNICRESIRKDFEEYAPDGGDD